jgi:ABC-2 type transport system permease protein
MRAFLATMFVIARRDFLSIVATPTFLLFLLAPLFMIGMGLVGGMGARGLAESTRDSGRIVALTDAANVAALRDADARQRDASGPFAAPMLELRPVTTTPDEAAIRAIFAERSSDILAVMAGPLAAPQIWHRDGSERNGRYLVLVAEQALRDQALAGAGASAAAPRVSAEIRALAATGTSNAVRQTLGFGAVFVLFFLSLLLASQTVSSLAEEKGNKVIEILAASAPLEAVFLGKLFGFLGVALLFISFWLGLALVAGLVGVGVMASGGAAASAGGAAMLAAVAPATGWAFFLGMGFVYFIIAFFLLGATFLGIGSQASSVREIQMLSLPITIFQVAMFGLASAASSTPGSPLARFAEIFPFSSPFAMAARAATDESRLVHGAALAWQLLWVVIVVALAVRLFRGGVLSGRSNWAFWRKARRPH